jgi:hypothetical protein
MLDVVDQAVDSGRKAAEQPVRSLCDRIEYRLHI